jgi:hypothetical protein
MVSEGKLILQQALPTCACMMLQRNGILREDEESQAFWARHPRCSLGFCQIISPGSTQCGIVKLGGNEPVIQVA